VIHEIGGLRCHHGFEAAQEPSVCHGIKVSVVVQDLRAGIESRSATSCSRTDDQRPFSSASASAASRISSRSSGARSTTCCVLEGGSRWPEEAMSSSVYDCAKGRYRSGLYGSRLHHRLACGVVELLGGST
jgi:hypothetical protein